MKLLKIALVVAVFTGAMSLSSCGKKGILKPEDKKGKHSCSHTNDSSSERTTEAGT
jgi:predicted small lipoprotein YifL